MSTFFRTIPHTKKPDVPYKVNWKNGIARDLHHFVPMWEGGGATAYDIVNGEDIVFDPSRKLLWKSGGQGRFLSSPNAQDLQGTISGTSHAAPWSIEFMIRPTGDPGTYGTVYTTSGTKGLFLLDSAGTPRWTWYTGANQNSSTFSYGEWQQLMLVFTLSGGTEYLDFYINGKFDTQHAMSAGASTLTANSFFGHTGEYFDGDCAYMRVWHRALTAYEVLSLYKQPWQLLAPQTQLIEIPDTVSGGRIMSSLAGSGGYIDWGDFHPWKYRKKPRFKYKDEEEAEVAPILEDIAEKTLETPVLETDKDLEIVLKLRLRLANLEYKATYMQWLREQRRKKREFVKKAVKRRRKQQQEEEAIIFYLLN